MRRNVSMNGSPSSRSVTYTSENTIERLGHIRVGHRRSDHLSDRRIQTAGGAAERDLVPLLAALIDAQNADVSDGVMAAAVHAARHFQLDVAQVVQVVEIVETLVDLFRDRNRSGIRERAEVESWAANHVGERADIRRREIDRFQRLPHFEQISLLHIGEQQVLIVRGANETERILVGEIRHSIHFLVRHVARRSCRRFQGNERDTIARHLVPLRVALIPGAEFGRPSRQHIFVGQLLVARRREERFDALDLSCVVQGRHVLGSCVLRLDHLAEFLRTDSFDENLDASLVDVVAATFEVVHAQDRFEICEQLSLRQKLANDVTDHRRATQSATNEHFEADLTVSHCERGGDRCRELREAARSCGEPVTAILNLRGRYENSG